MLIQAKRDRAFIIIHTLEQSQTDARAQRNTKTFVAVGQVQFNDGNSSFYQSINTYTHTQIKQKNSKDIKQKEKNTQKFSKPCTFDSNSWPKKTLQ